MEFVLLMWVVVVVVKIAEKFARIVLRCCTGDSCCTGGLHWVGASHVLVVAPSKKGVVTTECVEAAASTVFVERMMAAQLDA